ncbi:putative transposase [Orenia metallireducens]|uniref:Putative transposase n=1 Tax=Orenia metallireducens TaxID=1413210 RepID=A0A285GEE3_9FIRM|nr:RNA-guided endonuclease TnpB family protein [Orenia metallireducens]PRX32592.1 putative transposase [Orenia metallireducens]SNY20741.1 putative transposase [Orenia metallireducens]
MIKSIKIRLKPTKEQEILMFKSVGCARFAYNWGLARWRDMNKQGIKPSKLKISKEFTKMKKKEEYKWLYEVSAQVTAQAFEDLNVAYQNFFKGKANKPKFKTKRKSKKSFYVRYDAVYFKNSKVNMEKIGKVEYSTNYDIPDLDKYINPRCYFDGKYWYLTLGFEHGENQVKLSKDLSVGIDLGIKELAVVSCLKKPIKNINKSSKIRKLKKKLKRLQKQVSRKYEMNKQGNEFVKTKNIIKLEKQIKLVYRKLANIRLNYIHQATNKIVKLKPYRVVMEDINITGMMKNKHLSKAIQEQKLYEFIRQMKYKCEFNGIEFIQVDRFYPSSKTCSECGSVKKDLKLSDRVYKCSKCGLEIDRDKNASINLANYEELA